MGRRNPMNERYGKYTSPSGKTRKSAASAKPKRAKGSTASSSSKKSSSSSSRRKAALVLHPDTPAYKRMRRVWWSFLGGAVVLSTVAWWLWQEPARRAIGNWVLGAGYALIFAAMYIDWMKLRPMRSEWAARQSGAGSEKADKKSDES